MAGCSDMLKCWLRGEWPPAGGEELGHCVRGSAEVPQTGVSLEHCCMVTAGSTVMSIWCPVWSPRQEEMQVINKQDP